jgi:hypothetical protein
MSKRNPPSVPDTPKVTGQQPQPVRRRLLHGGLAAGPVLMTLISRPVLGQVQCQTPSAFVSGNASLAGAAVLCEGHSADYWANNPNWPSPYTPDTQFNDVFGSGYPCTTLLDVLTPPDQLPVDPPVAHQHGHKHKHAPDSLDRRGLDRDGLDPAPHERSLDQVVLGQGVHDPLNQATHDPLSQGTHDPLSLATHNPETLGHGARDQGAPKHKAPHNHGHGRNPPTPELSGSGTPTPLGCENAGDATAGTGTSLPGSSKKGRRHHSHSPHDHVARGVVTALLNAHAGLTPVLPVQTVKGIWKEYLTTGYYEPTAGVQWGEQQILTYLTSTQPA